MSTPSQFLLYTAPDRAVKVDVFFKDETRLRRQDLKQLCPNRMPSFASRLCDPQQQRDRLVGQFRECFDQRRATEPSQPLVTGRKPPVFQCLDQWR